MNTSFTLRAFNFRALASTPISIVLVASTLYLSGCSSGEEREAKYLERAQAAFEAEDYEKARVDLRNVLQINTSNAQARFLFARLEERQQNWPQMYANLSAAVESDPTLWEARIKLAELLIASSQIEKANEQIDAVLAHDPDHPEALAARAGVLFREQKLAEAELLCQKILEKTPGHITATGLLAAIYGNSDPVKALATVEKGIDSNPSNITLQLLRIQLLTRMGNTEDVIDAYQKLITQNPEALIYPVQLAAYLNVLHRNDEAESAIREMLKRNPDADQAKLILVDFLARTERAPEALETLQGFVDGSPDNHLLRVALARLHIALNEIDKAEAIYHGIIGKDPRSAEAIDARNKLIELSLGKGERAAADKLLAENLDIEPENGDALLIRAKILLHENKAESAIADLRTVLKNSPSSIPALELLGPAQERIGASNLALDSYQQLLQINASNLTGLTGAARLLLAEGKLDDAARLLEQAYKLAPGNYDVAKQLVDIFSRQKKWDQALEIAQNLILRQESASAGHYLRGMVLERRGDTEGAIEALQNSLNKEPRAIEPLKALLSMYIRSNQSAKALAYAENHVKQYPDQLHAQELLAALYHQQGRRQDAERLLTEIIKKDPKRVSAYRELSAVFIAEKRKDKVHALLNEGLSQNPDNPGLMLLLAELHQSNGDNAEALAMYERLEKALPNSDIVRNNLAMLLVEVSPSEENLRRAMRLTAHFERSNNPVFLDTLGWIHVKSGNYPQAISLLEDAVRRQPAPELRYHLGIAYVRNNMVDKGREQLELATEGDTPYAWRAEAEQTLRQTEQIN